MEKNGLNSRNEREATLAKLASAFRSIASSEDRSGYNVALKELLSVSFEASRDGNALHALKLERQCVASGRWKTILSGTGGRQDGILCRPAGESESRARTLPGALARGAFSGCGKAGEGNPGTRSHRGAEDFCRTAHRWPDVQRRDHPRERGTRLLRAEDRQWPIRP